MKKYLILLVSIITVQTLFGQQSMMKKASNCDCLYFEDSQTQFTWDGPCKNGYVDGNGTIQYYYNGKKTAKIVGSFVNGKCVGICKIYGEYGIIFKGDFKESCFYRPDDNSSNTEMAQTYLTTENDYNNGYGVYKYHSGEVYKGNWVNGKRNGYGEIYYPNGKILYKGQFENDSKHGQGIIYDIIGNIIYNGYISGYDEYAYDRPQYTVLEGTRFNGKCIDIMTNDHSALNWDQQSKTQTGDYYIGYVKDQNFSGYGTYHYLNGDIHQGSWLVGYPHGYGKIIDKYGNIKIEGTWEYAKLKTNDYNNNSTTYSNNNSSSTNSSSNNLTSNQDRNKIRFGDWSDNYKLIKNMDIYYKVKDIQVTDPTSGKVIHQFGFKFNNNTNNKVSFKFRFAIDDKETGMEMLSGGKIWHSVNINPNQEFGDELTFNTGVLTDKEFTYGKLYLKDINTYNSNSDIDWVKVGTVAFFIGGALAIANELFKSKENNNDEGEIESFNKCDRSTSNSIDLYILSIGTDVKNMSTAMDNDAIQIVDKLREGCGNKNLFGNVYSKTIIGSDATKSNILTALNQIKLKTNEDDIFLLFFSGHGGVINEKFVFASRNGYTSVDEIIQGLDADNCKTIMWFDACHAGQVGIDFKNNVDDYIKNKKMPNVSIMMSSSDNESSYTDTNNNMGYFAKAIIDGLKGNADQSDMNHFISLRELVNYVVKVVPARTRNSSNCKTQTPQVLNEGKSFNTRLSYY